MVLTEEIYSCAAGETFDSVALRLFGSEKYAAELLGANPELCRKSVFTGGEELNIPEIEIPDKSEENIPTTAPWRSE